MKMWMRRLPPICLVIRRYPLCSSLRITGLVVIVILILVIFFCYIPSGSEDEGGTSSSKAEGLLEEAAKIAELKQTITSLLDNMPGMNYTKDAETGKFLACNQAFADYAHKKSPEEVIGLTAYDIFDERKQQSIS